MIRGKIVNLRAIEERDLETIRRWRNRDYIRKCCREYLLLNMFNQKTWFESLAEKPPKNIMFVVQKDKKMIGVCGLTYIDWKNRNTEVSCYLASSDWYLNEEAEETIFLLLNYGFKDLNLHRIYVTKYDFDESVELYRKIGFKTEGRTRESVFQDGQYWDTHYLGILVSEWRSMSG